jgi:hypothetical protein
MSVVDTLVHVQVPQAILQKSPDLCLVASQWCRLIHAVLFCLVSYNLCLHHRDARHDRSNGVWFDVEGYWGLVIFEDKQLIGMGLCLFCGVLFCVKRGRKLWFVLFDGCSFK